jgi:RNA polymerase sigma factor (sigma-70 family)
VRSEETTKPLEPMLGAVCQGNPVLENPAIAARLIELTRDERIASVGPMIVSVAKKFWDSLMPREKASHSPEDIAAELWIEIAEKDEKWNPDSGAYTTFAMMLMEHKVEDIRSKCRVVHSPRNAVARIKSSDGSPKSERTARKILASMKESVGIDAAGINPVADDEAEAAARAERMANKLDLAKRHVAKLPDPLARTVLSMYYGLGRDAMKQRAIAEALGRTDAEIRAARKRGERLLKQAVASEDLAIYLG